MNYHHKQPLKWLHFATNSAHNRLGCDANFSKSAVRYPELWSVHSIAFRMQVNGLGEFLYVEIVRHHEVSTVLRCPLDEFLLYWLQMNWLILC